MADQVYRVRTKYQVDTKEAEHAVDALSAKLDGLWSTIKRAATFFGFAALISQVMQLHGAAETTRIAIAGLMKAGDAMGTSGPEGWTNAMGMSAAILAKMRKDAADLPGEFQDLVNIFRQALPGGLRAGQSILGVEQMSSKLMAVAASLQIDSQTAAHNLAQMMQGRAISHSPLWAALKSQMTDDKGKQLTLAQFNALSDAKRWDTIGKALDKYGDVMNEFQTTWEAVSSTAADAGKTIMKAFGADIFKVVKTRLYEINNLFAANEELVKRGAGMIGGLFARALDAVLRAVIFTLTALAPLVTTIGETYNRLAPTFDRLADMITGALTGIVSAVGAVIAAVLPYVLAFTEGFLTGFVTGVELAWEGVARFWQGLVVLGRAIGEAGASLLRLFGIEVSFSSGTGEAIDMVRELGRMIGIAVGVLGVLAVAVKIITGLQWLWNVAMAANPIGLIVMLIVALVAAIGMLILYWDKVTIAAEEAFLAMRKAAALPLAVYGANPALQMAYGNEQVAAGIQTDLARRKDALAAKDAAGRGGFMARLQDTLGIDLAAKLGIGAAKGYVGADQGTDEQRLAKYMKMLGLTPDGKKRDNQQANVNVSVRIEQTVNDARDPDRIRLVTLDAINEVLEHAMNNPNVNPANRFATMRP